MTHPALLAILNDIATQITDEIENPNYGGCGVIAATVGRELQALGLKVDVVTPCVQGMFRSLPANVVRPLVSNIGDTCEWDDNGLNRGHLAVRFEHDGTIYTWDSLGLVPSEHVFGDFRYKTSTTLGEGLTVDEAAAMSGDDRGWCPDFNRAQIPDVVRIVRDNFSAMSQ